MNKKLPNLSCVLRTSSKAKPWKVERRMGRYEHVNFTPRLMRSTESFYVVMVGRFKHLWQAENAAMRSAQRHGGFAKDAKGGLWPNRPIRAKESNLKADVAPASGAHVQRVVGCELSTGEKP